MAFTLHGPDIKTERDFFLVNSQVCSTGRNPGRHSHRGCQTGRKGPLTYMAAWCPAVMGRGDFNATAISIQGRSNLHSRSYSRHWPTSFTWFDGKGLFRFGMKAAIMSGGPVRSDLDIKTYKYNARSTKQRRTHMQISQTLSTTMMMSVSSVQTQIIRKCVTQNRRR